MFLGPLARRFSVPRDFRGSSPKGDCCLKLNPYSSPDFDRVVSSRSWIGSAARAIAYLYPLALPVFLYATWGIAALKLGRPPIPHLEYPGGAELVVLGHITAVLHLLAPLAIPVGVLISIVHPFARRNNQTAAVKIRMFSFLAYISLCVIAFVVLFHDPYRAADWFWD